MLSIAFKNNSSAITKFKTFNVYNSSQELIESVNNLNNY